MKSAKGTQLSTTALWVGILALFCVSGQAQVLFTNFGPMFSYDTNPADSDFINGTTCPTGAVTVGANFRPSITAFFQDAKLPLGLVSGTNQLSVYLESDVAGSPGAIIEGPINVTGLMASPGSVHTANSTLHPLLVAGTPYWLIVVAMNADTCGLWFTNSTNDLSDGTNLVFHAFASPAGPWQFVRAGIQRPAFEIDGTTTTSADVFRVRYASNLSQGDSVVNITNTGASATTVLSPGQAGPIAQNNIDGNICVNIYAFAADEQEVACCSCLVTPNALWSASVKTALLNSTLTPSFPNEVVIKLISSAPNVGTNNTQSCNPASVTVAGLASGVAAWGTSALGVPTSTGPTFQVTETPFASAALSLVELQRDVQECQFIQILGSGQFGMCKGCSNVGLGAAAQ